MAKHQSRPPNGLLYIEDHVDEDGRVVPGIASRLGITPSTYRKWRMRGEGPKAFLLGKKVAARIEAVDEYYAELERASQEPCTAA